MALSGFVSTGFNWKFQFQNIDGRWRLRERKRENCSGSSIFHLIDTLNWWACIKLYIFLRGTMESLLRLCALEELSTGWGKPSGGPATERSI